MGRIVDQDEILMELVDSLKEQNEDLKKQLKDKPRSILGVAEMWSAFWSTIGGMWKDFWASISSMWSNVWDKDESILGFTILSIVAVVALGLASYGILSPVGPAKPVVKLISKYHITTGFYKAEKDCFYVSQEKTNGDTQRITPCIKDKDEALKTLREIKEEVQ